MEDILKCEEMLKTIFVSLPFVPVRVPCRNTSHTTVKYLGLYVLGTLKKNKSQGKFCSIFLSEVIGRYCVP